LNKRITAVLSSMAVAAILAGCSTVSESSDLEPVNLSDETVVSALCGENAGDIADFVASAMEAPERSGKRNALTDWELDPTDTESHATIIATLDERANVACDSTAQSEETLESSLTLDESLWGDLSWEYPAEYVELVREYGYDTQEFSGEEFPVPVAGTLLNGKQDTDSVRPPLAEKSAKQVIAIVLSEFDVGAQAGSGLANMPAIVNGKTLLELNPWLEEFADPAKINDWATEAIGGSEVEQLIAAKKLVLVAMLFERVGPNGIAIKQTSFNFHLVWNEDGGTLAIDPSNPKAIPEFELNPHQYEGEFVMFEVTLKGIEGCWLQFGINTGDGRFAGFACPTPVTPPVTPPETTPECVVNCGGGNAPKTGTVPRETSNGGTETPAPAPTGTPDAPEEVDTDPVDEIDTGTDLDSQDPDDTNTGAVTD